MGSRQEHAVNGMIFAVFGLSSGTPECAWHGNIFKIGDGVFNSRDSSFCKAICTITTKQPKARFLVLKSIIKHVRESFALFTVVKARIFVGGKVKTLLVWTCWTIDISDNI